MGGIAGFFGSAHPEQARGCLEAMIRPLRHRGPRSVGFHVNGSMGLAHAQSVTTSDATLGADPFTNERGDIVVVADLDVFNSGELRERLGTLGHRFATSLDAELVVRLYEQYGEGFLDELNGQFALALWDARKRRLLLARDPLGTRPLYYTETAGKLWFASEIKALLAVLPERAAFSVEGLAQAFTYWAPLEPTTVFDRVLSLPAGHFLSIDETGPRPPKRYWDLHFPPAEKARRPAPSFSQAVAELRDALTSSVRVRMRAEAPVGAYLSGGLDSSSVVALMSQLSPRPVRTFSIRFEDEAFDESSQQALVARHFRTEHSSLRCSHRDIAEVFPKLIRHVEAPLLRTAPAPLLLLSAHVREAGYETVLTGEGADEIFLGYDLFKEALIRRFCARQPLSPFRPSLFARLYPYLEHSPAKAPAMARGFFAQGSAHLDMPVFAHLPRWTTSGRALAFFSRGLREELRDWDPIAACERTLPAGIDQWEPLSRYQYVEAKTLLTGHLLGSQGDRVAMAHGVGGRMPYLDPRIIELASGYPAHWKLQGLREKHILRRALEGLLPETIRRRPKQPFRAPDSRSFFAGGEAIGYIDDLLDEKRIRETGIFDPAAVSRLREKCRAGRAIGFSDNQAFVGIVSTMLLDDSFMRSRHLA